MDVRMPDGTIITNVPDTISQSELLKMVNNTKLSTPDVFKQTAQEQSGVQNFLAGVGGGMTGLALGLGQRLGLVEQEAIDDHQKAMAGLRSTKSGIAGDLVGTAATLAPSALIPGANTAIGSALIGAGAGALNPTGKGESVIDNMALGGAGGWVGQKIGNGIAKLLAGRASAPAAASAASSGGNASASSTVTGGVNARASGGGYTFGSVGDDVSAGLNAAQRRAMDTGESLGFKLTPGQASGSRSLQQLEAKLESQPMTSGTFNTIKSNNQTTLNRIAAKAIGEDSATLDSTVLQQAQDRIGSVYKMVADKTPRRIDPDEFLNKLSAVEGDFEGLAKIADNPLVNKFLNYAAKGEATGAQLQDLASKLGKAANNAMTSQGGDRQMGMALFAVKDHVDDLLESSLKGSTLDAFKTARQQYRNLMLLTQRSGVVNPSSGNVQGGALAQMLQQKDRPGFLFGKNDSDLYNAARFAQAFRPIVGDSGTATRMPLPSPTDFMLSLPFSIATKAYTSAPVVNVSAMTADVARNGLVPGVTAEWLRSRLGPAGMVAGGLLGQAQ